MKLKLRREVPDPEPAAATDAQLPARLQAARLLERVVSGAPGAERRHRELRHPGGARALDRGRGRRRARDRHADPRDRVHARRAADRGADPRTRRPLARRGLGRQPAGVPGHDRHRLPQPPLPLRPEPEPRATPRSSTCSSRSSPTRSTRCARCAPGARPSSRCVRRSRPPTTRSSRSGSPDRLGHAAAAAGTSTATDATRSSGPASPSSTGAAMRRFDAAAYRLAAAPRATRYPVRGFGGAGSVTL